MLAAKHTTRLLMRRYPVPTKAAGRGIAEIFEFRAFWRSDGKQFRQVQWELKLAKRLAEGRQYKVSKALRRDVNAIPDMCYEIPEGAGKGKNGRPCVALSLL